MGPAALGVIAVPGTEPPWMDHHPRSCISKDFCGLQNLLRFQLGDRCCPFRSGIRYGMFQFIEPGAMLLNKLMIVVSLADEEVDERE